jgi:Type II secretory pathway, component PulK
MHANEARSFSNDEAGCATHGLLDCLCDVQPLDEPVPIQAVPHAERLLELGVDRFNFVKWAEEVAAWMDSQANVLWLAAEA